MSSKRIARLAMVASVIVVAYGVDSAITSGMILLGATFRIAVATVVVTLTLVQLFDLKTAVFATTVFGLVSFVGAYVFPTPTSVYFVQPHISILPRIVIGFVSYGVYKGLSRVMASKTSIFWREYFPRAAAGGAGALTNTVLVLSLIATAGGTDALKSVIAFVLSVNFAIEFFSAVIIVPTLARTLEKSSALRAIRG